MVSAGGFEVAQKTSRWPGINYSKRFKESRWGKSMGDDLAIVTATLLLTGSVVVILFWL